MIGVSSRCSCRGLFKKNYIISVPCEYIFSLMMFIVLSISGPTTAVAIFRNPNTIPLMFIVNNLDNFQIYSVVRGVNTKDKYQFHRPTVNLSRIQKRVFYSSIKVFNILLTYILKLMLP
jgi:hypothetical protein